MDIEFTDPPLRQGGGTRLVNWPEFFDALRARPGEWAKFPTHVNAATSHQIKAGRKAGISRGEFEATVRVGEDLPAGRYHMWVRYVGGES